MAGLGILSARLPASADGWAQLLPAGYFQSIDGRPDDVPSGQWFLDGTIAAALISRLSGLKNDRVIDYEHQTLNSERNGQPAIAAGWFGVSEIEWREGDGLYIKPRWTDKARGHIRADEYRYLSAVFSYDKTTGAPQAIQMVALVNYPGLDGLHPVSALKGQAFTIPTNEEPVMEQWIKDLLARLEQPVTETLDEAQGQAILSAVSDLQARAATVDTLTHQVAALKADSGAVDLSQYVPKSVYDASLTEIATLKGQHSQQSVAQVIREALDEGRAFAREEAYLTRFGEQQGEAALKAMLEQRPALAALKGQQSSGRPLLPVPGEQQLSQDELAVLKATGISRDAFLKQRDND